MAGDDLSVGAPTTDLEHHQAHDRRLLGGMRGGPSRPSLPSSPLRGEEEGTYFPFQASDAPAPRHARAPPQQAHMPTSASLLDLEWGLAAGSYTTSHLQEYPHPQSSTTPHPFHSTHRQSHSHHPLHTIHGSDLTQEEMENLTYDLSQRAGGGQGRSTSMGASPGLHHAGSPSWNSAMTPLQMQMPALTEFYTQAQAPVRGRPPAPGSSSAHSPSSTTAAADTDSYAHELRMQQQAQMRRLQEQAHRQDEEHDYLASLGVLPYPLSHPTHAHHPSHLSHPSHPSHPSSQPPFFEDMHMDHRQPFQMHHLQGSGQGMHSPIGMDAHAYHHPLMEAHYLDEQGRASPAMIKYESPSGHLSPPLC